jgi:hypothetical protein
VDAAQVSAEVPVEHRNTASPTPEPRHDDALPPTAGELLSVLRAVSPTSLDAVDLASITALSREDLRICLDALMSQQLVTAVNLHPQSTDRPVQILYRAS